MLKEMSDGGCRWLFKSAVLSVCGAVWQAIDAKGYQQELPDIWLTNGNPWEIGRPEITYKIGFYGTVDNFKWSPAEEVTLPALISFFPSILLSFPSG